VINLTSSQQLFQGWRAWQRWDMGAVGGSEPRMHMDTLISKDERRAPIVTVLDGSSHTLAWLGSVYGTRVISLGVDDFGQSGSIADLYRHYEIDAERIAMAAFSTLDDMRD
jgi:pyruvate dehydrogenase E1 component